MTIQTDTPGHARIAIAMVPIAGVLASITMYALTPHGPGVSPDGVAYIELAGHLLNGEGYVIDRDQSFTARRERTPCTHFPPGYPIALALSSICCNSDVPAAARVLGALLFGANLILFATAIYWGTAHNRAATGLAILFYLTSRPLFTTHSKVMSESLFLTFSLLALLLLTRHIRHPGRYAVVAAALLVGVAATTRAVGITLGPPIIGVLLLQSGRSLRNRIRETLLFTSCALLPIGCWVLRNTMYAQSAAQVRRLGWHPVSLPEFEDLVKTMYKFWSPVSLPLRGQGLLIVIAGVVVLAAAVLLYRRNSKPGVTQSPSFTLGSLGIFFFCTYLATVLFSISFLDGSTSLDTRIMLPPLLLMTIGVVSMAWSISRSLPRKGIWPSCLALALLCIGLSARPAARNVRDIYKDGQGYTSTVWQGSELISYLQSVDGDREIYTNGPDALRLWTGRISTLLPGRQDGSTKQPLPEYENQMDQMAAACRSGDALIVYFNNITWRWYLPSVDDLVEMNALPAARTFADGFVWSQDRASKVVDAD